MRSELADGMRVDCTVCGELGFYCRSKSLSSQERVAITLEQNAVLAKIGQGIGTCEVEELELVEFQDDDELESEIEILDQELPELNYEKLMPLVLALRMMSKITDGDLANLQEFRQGIFYVPALINLVKKAVKNENEAAIERKPQRLSDKRGKEAVDYIQTALTSPELRTVFDYGKDGIQIAGKEEDSFGGDLIGYFTPEAREFLGNKYELKIQSKSDNDRVLEWYALLLKKCRRTKDRCYLERDPNKKPLVVLNGHGLDLSMKAHFGFQLAANAMIQNQGTTREQMFDATKEFIHFLPPEIIIYMYHLEKTPALERGLPMHILEMNELLAIADGFRHAPNHGLEPTKQVDPRTSFIIEEVLGRGEKLAKHGLPENISRFALNQM